MNDNRLIQKIRLRNLLSFGDKAEDVELRQLNVIIGPNASGKSNFIEAIKLLKSAADNRFSATLINGGGISEYLWKGTMQVYPAEIHGIFSSDPDVIYKLVFTKIGQQVEILEEEILSTKIQHDEAFYYRNKNAKSEIANWSRTVNWGDFTWGERTLLDKDRLNSQNSVFSQFRDQVNYPAISILANNLEKIKIYKDLIFYPTRSPRQPVQASLFGDFLSTDTENLAIVLNDLQSQYFQAYQEVIDRLKKIYGRIDRVNTHLQGGSVQINFQEQGLEHQVSATRLSDGTLRYLCLLAILCHPEPPPLICIEEPEIGLHPDVLPEIAGLLIEASKRTQLIVTTHSDILISALSDIPEAVLVCERDEDGTHLNRLDKESLKIWLEEYSLGDLWLKGEIGGTRW